MPPTARQLEQRLLRAGWQRVKAKGGHRQYKHPDRPGRVTLPWHGSGGAELGPKTVKSVERQAGL